MIIYFYNFFFFWISGTNPLTFTKQVKPVRVWTRCPGEMSVAKSYSLNHVCMSCNSHAYMQTMQYYFWKIRTDIRTYLIPSSIKSTDTITLSLSFTLSHFYCNIKAASKSAFNQAQVCWYLNFHSHCNSMHVIAINLLYFHMM